MAPRVEAVAIVSPQNHPILVRTYATPELKYHYLAHTSLDVIEERLTAGGKNVECYLGLLYAMDDVAVYGYITSLKVKIILALALSDAVVRDADVIQIFKALHTAYYRSTANPFLKLRAPIESDQSVTGLAGKSRWKVFRKSIDDIVQAIGPNIPLSAT